MAKTDAAFREFLQWVEDSKPHYKQQFIGAYGEDEYKKHMFKVALFVWEHEFRILEGENGDNLQFPEFLARKEQEILAEKLGAIKSKGSHPKYGFKYVR